MWKCRLVEKFAIACRVSGLGLSLWAFGLKRYVQSKEKSGPPTRLARRKSNQISTDRHARVGRHLFFAEPSTLARRSLWLQMVPCCPLNRLGPNQMLLSPLRTSPASRNQWPVERGEYCRRRQTFAGGDFPHRQRPDWAA